MSVSGITSSNFFQQAQELSGIAKDLQNLQKSLRSNDLSGARDAFAQFLKDLGTSSAAQLTPSSATADSAGTAANISGSNSVSALQRDLQNLQLALQSGNLSDAQGAFKQLRSDLKSLAGQSGQDNGRANNLSYSSSTSITEINVNVVATGGSNVNVVV
jgi:hypothetical protein